MLSGRTNLFSRRQVLGAATALAPAPLFAASGKSPRHGIVYMEPGHYGGWPANHGIWSWGNEVVVGFTAAYYKPVERGHAVDRDRPFENWQARSLDGGETWTIEKPEVFGVKESKALAAPLDFEAPGFALMFRLSNIQVGPTRTFVSTDRGRTWAGPYGFAVQGIEKIASRTDYHVLGKRSCLMFGSAAKANDREGRIFCARTTDGGLTWNLVSRIGPEPAGYMIMPSSVRLGKDRFLTTIRHKDPDRQGSIDAYRTDDGGKTWSFLGAAASEIGSGNPPSLVPLRDGRLALAYGYRAKPFGMRAKVSSDQGRTWGEEIVLRDDALTGDLGYPRSILRPDGKVLTVYYYNGPRDEDRAIRYTIWTP